MNAVAMSPPGGWVLDFMQHRLERALRQRVRYRYVQPRVLREGEAFRIESPCCSRNVDASGGVIDIALLAPGPMRLSRDRPGRMVQSWRLFARDHAAQAWVPQHESEQVDELMDLLCVDAERIFWR
jgi:hypothetical protein